MATSIDDNAADEKSAKSRCQLFIIRCTRSQRRGEIDNFHFVCMINLNSILATFPEWGQKVPPLSLFGGGEKRYHIS